MAGLPWFVWFIAGGVLLPLAFIVSVCLYDYLTERYGSRASVPLRALVICVWLMLVIAMQDSMLRWFGLD